MTAICPLMVSWPGFHGRYHKGHMRCVRAFRRHRAEWRQAEERARDRERQLAAELPGADGRRLCPWPWKDQFGSLAEASARLVSVRERTDKAKRIEPFECRIGRHWHLGRPVFRAVPPRLARAGDSR